MAAKTITEVSSPIKMVVLHGAGGSTQVFEVNTIKRIEAHGGGDLGPGLFSKLWINEGGAALTYIIDIQEPFDLIMSLMIAP